TRRCERGFEMSTSDERLRRWRLILGGDEADGVGLTLGGPDLAMDRALAALYDAGGQEGRKSRAAASAPDVGRWLRGNSQLLSFVGRPRDAAGRAGAVELAADAPSTRNARSCRAGRASGCQPAGARRRDAREDKRDRASGGSQSRRRIGTPAG